VRIVFLLATTMMFATACETGPDPIEVETAAARKVCGRLFSSSSKVYQDELYKRGVAEVKFADKTAFVEMCVGMKLSKDDLRCADPNLASSKDCKDLSADLATKHKELKEFMIAPTIALLKAKAGGGEAEGQAAGGATPADGEAAPAEGVVPADGTVAPPDGTVAPADGTVAPADGTAAPADGAVAPADGAAAPADGEAMPVESVAK
jgi:hypothetical protein